MEYTTYSYVRGSRLESTVKIIPDGVMFYLRTAFSVVLTILVATVGIIANIVNIIVYHKLGFRDSVNITFMALSVWDLSLCLSCEIIAVFYLVDAYFPLPYFNTLPIRFVYIAHITALTNILSTIVTGFLSLERCVCIVFPLKVKEILTTRRVILVNLTIVMFGVAAICPAWATQATQWVFNPADNRTRLVLWLSANRHEIDVFVDTFNGMMIPMVAQVLITISSGFMIHGINKSSQLRKRSSNYGSLGDTYNPQSKSLSKVAGSHRLSKRKTMTSKDVKLTKVVVSLTILFFTCNFPAIVNIFVRLLFPEVNVGKQQHNVYEFLFVLVYLCSLVKSTVNIVVYVYASSRYRRELLILFGRM
ncbi:unnamed protein product [Candidula unifasciata]|uniref:G-protein coupled receptors family 1 profile domain-containing protein n=1 Tax=Candidula unifasciata TaxID=100452 RepID=A0A8S3ZYW7_9EUPU|nr:unnamed protein product [Candidula unifasciata]